MLVSADFPFQNHERLIVQSAEQEMGVLAIRVLAGGALTGSTARHNNATPGVDPIASSAAYADDVVLAGRFAFLVDVGFAGSLVEAAIRFAIGKPEVSTALVGISDMKQLEQAAEAVGRGPLPAAALRRLDEVWMEKL